MVKIRLMRIGTKGRPFYRVVAVDERKKRTGEYLELLGTYNPLTEPHEIILKQDRIDSWVKNGAILSDGYLRITKQSPQRPPRKPKKEKEAKEPKGPEEPNEPKVEETETANEEPAAEETQADTSGLQGPAEQITNAGGPEETRLPAPERNDGGQGSQA